MSCPHGNPTSRECRPCQTRYQSESRRRRKARGGALPPPKATAWPRTRQEAQLDRLATAWLVGWRIAA